jgi:hypothetical protein
MLKSVISIAAYAATIPLANWMIGHVGQCVPNGPCLIPVGFGFLAPSGVLMVGASLVLRDFVQETAGVKGALIAIAIGAVASWFFAPPFLVVASVLAFLLAEIGDLAVYTPVRAKSMVLAVLLSGVVGSVVDSAVFLYVAFGSFDFIVGQIIGKLWMSVFGASLLAFAHSRKQKKA